MSELVALQPNNLPRLETLFDWTLEASRAAAELKQADEARKLTEEVKALIDRMVKLENPELEGGKSVAEKDLKGTYWRFAKAAYLISQWQNDHSSDPNARPAKSAELEQAKRYAEEIKNARPSGGEVPPPGSDCRAQPRACRGDHPRLPAGHRAGLHGPDGRPATGPVAHGAESIR